MLLSLLFIWAGLFRTCKRLEGEAVCLFLSRLFLGEEPLVVVRVPLREVLGWRVSPGSWVLGSDPEEVPDAVKFVRLHVRRPALESRLIPK